MALIGAASAATVAWRQLQETRRHQQRNEELMEEGQITERFTRAIEQLGNKDQLDVTLGGIYALERIAKDSKADRATITEILTAHVRGHVPWSPDASAQPPEDTPPDLLTRLQVRHPNVQAALTVLGRMPSDDQLRFVDLRTTDLRAAFLVKANLQTSVLIDAHLEGAFLVGADLQRSLLIDAHLEGANLKEAHLEDADLSRAHLKGADLRGVHLAGADLGGAHLVEANLYEANLLKRANLQDAHLERADLRKALLEGANLQDAHLEGAHLEDAHLNGANLQDAHLERADLRLADLGHADFYRASMQGAT